LGRRRIGGGSGDDSRELDDVEGVRVGGSAATAGDAALSTRRSSVRWQAHPCPQAHVPALWKVWQTQPSTSHAWCGRASCSDERWPQVQTAATGMKANCLQRHPSTAQRNGPPGFNGAWSARLWPQKQLDVDFARLHGCNAFLTGPGEVPRSCISQAPQIQTASSKGVCLAACCGADDGRCTGPAFAAPLPVRPRQPSKHSFAREMAWKRFVDSTASCSGFLSG